MPRTRLLILASPLGCNAPERYQPASWRVLESWESLGGEGELAWRGFDNEQVHDPPLLFDLSTNLGERFDIAGRHPGTIERIEDAIREHRESLSGPAVQSVP
jgi:hypothetical protein